MDAELEAMGVVFEALKPLDRDTRKRVSHWVEQKLASLEPAPVAGPLVLEDGGVITTEGHSLAESRINRAVESGRVRLMVPRSGKTSPMRVAMLRVMGGFKEAFSTAEVAEALRSRGEEEAAKYVSQAFNEWEKRDPKILTAAGKRPSGPLGGLPRRLYRLTAAGWEKVREATQQAQAQEEELPREAVL